MEKKAIAWSMGAGSIRGDIYWMASEMEALKGEGTNVKGEISGVKREITEVKEGVGKIEAKLDKLLGLLASRSSQILV